MSSTNDQIVASSDRLGEEVSLGKVFELLLSAVFLHKKSFITLLSMIADKNVSNVACRNALSNMILSASKGPVGEGVLYATGSFVDSASGRFINYHTTGAKEQIISSSEIWARLRINPAVRDPQKTLEILGSIIQDGLVDSILPYVVSTLDLSCGGSNVPKSQLISSTLALEDKKSVTSSSQIENFKETNVNEKSSTTLINELEDDAAAKRTDDVIVDSKTSEQLSSNYSDRLDKGPPIVIHVCDEAHGLRQDFMCPRDLLINHIGYFADLAASQRLEDVDISVHCDINIFDWLLKWIKHQDSTSFKPPILEPKTAISILISAEFLKMEPLTKEVLKFIHGNTNRILEAQVNISCLTDSILSRLARLFTHWELESLKDPKDKLQNKLYSKFLQMLCDCHPLPSKGIFKTAAHIYMCSDCKKMINRNVEKLIECSATNTFLTSTGNVYFVHVRDVNWNLTDHVKQYKSELKTWRAVYWRLWGETHYLPCSTCGVVFPGTEMKQCRYHHSDPHFGAEALNPFVSCSGDSFPCCDARALRFSPLPLRNGCQYCDHTVQLTRRHNDIWGPIPQIYDDLLSFQHLICMEPISQEKKSQKVLWKEVSIIPSSTKFGSSFIDRSWLIEHRFTKGQTNVLTREVQEESPRISDSSKSTAEFSHPQKPSDFEAESSDGEEERGKRKFFSYRVKAMLLRRATRAKRAMYSVAQEPENRWDTTRSTRYNQDAQRDREIRIFRDLTSWLSLATSSSVDAVMGICPKVRVKADKSKKENISNFYDPGHFYRLEAEFKERTGVHDKSQGFTHPGGAFRAKVQAISRIKMRLRHRTAFSATR